MRDIFSLFFTFFKIGVITFGGGYSIMPIVERELVNGKKWVGMDEVLEYYTIGQITPGIIAVNLATFVGYKQKKILGSIIATIGFILPGIALVIFAAMLIKNFDKIPVVQHAFAGIRIVVGALVLQTIVKLAKALIQKQRGVFQNLIAVTIFVVCFILLLVWQVSPVLLVAVSGFAGFLCFRSPKTGNNA
jgi:chromate transporter